MGNPCEVEVFLFYQRGAPPIRCAITVDTGEDGWTPPPWMQFPHPKKRNTGVSGKLVMGMTREVWGPDGKSEEPILVYSYLDTLEECVVREWLLVEPVDPGIDSRINQEAWEWQEKFGGQ